MEAVSVGYGGPPILKNLSLRIDQDSDLEPLRTLWQTRMDDALVQAEKQLQRLARHLHKQIRRVKHPDAG